MTLLTICQNTARSVKVAVPSTVVGNSGDEAQLLLQCAQDAGEDLARRPPGGWVSMIREHDFSVAAIGPVSGTIANSGAGGVAQITGLASTTGLAADVWSVAGTGLPYNVAVASVDSATQVTLTAPASSTGAITDIEFSKTGYSLPSDFQRPVDNTMWDRQRYWQMRGPLSPQQWQFYKSSIYSRATVQRRFRMMRLGSSPTYYFTIDPPPTDNGSALVFEYVSNAWCMSSIGTLQTKWLADTDVGILDEYLLYLGTKWRFLERLGVAYDAALADYENQADKAVAHDGGAATLDIAPQPWPWLLSPYGIQDGSWPGSPSG